MSKAGPKKSCHSPFKGDKQADTYLEHNLQCFWPAKKRISKALYQTVSSIAYWNVQRRSHLCTISQRVRNANLQSFLHILGTKRPGYGQLMDIQCWVQNWRINLTRGLDLCSSLQSTVLSWKAPARNCSTNSLELSSNYGLNLPFR